MQCSEPVQSCMGELGWPKCVGMLGWFKLVGVLGWNIGKFNLPPYGIGSYLIHLVLI